MSASFNRSLSGVLRARDYPIDSSELSCPPEHTWAQGKVLTPHFRGRAYKRGLLFLTHDLPATQGRSNNFFSGGLTIKYCETLKNYISKRLRFSFDFHDNFICNRILHCFVEKLNFQMKISKKSQKYGFRGEGLDA